MVGNLEQPRQPDSVGSGFFATFFSLPAGIVAAVGLGAAFLLPPDGTGVPCPFRMLTGLPCPGCGLTRGVIAAAHGHFESAVRYHAFAVPVLIVLIVLALPWLLPRTWRQQLIARIMPLEPIAQRVGRVSIYTAIVFGLARMVLWKYGTWPWPL